jgi:hypothetical protein
MFLSAHVAPSIQPEFALGALLEALFKKHLSTI